jgi:uncharacterized protein (DUF433 family)
MHKGTKLRFLVCLCGYIFFVMKIRDFNRITFDPKIMTGMACVRGMRITVSLVLNLVANGMSNREILEQYPSLEDEDIKECLLYASMLTRER